MKLNLNNYSFSLYMFYYSSAEFIISFDFKAVTHLNFEIAFKSLIIILILSYALLILLLVSKTKVLFNPIFNQTRF